MGHPGGIKRSQLTARQFAGTVARQLLKKDQRPWHEHRVEALAQCSLQLPIFKAGRHDKGAEAGHAGIRFTFRQEKRGIDDAGDLHDLVIEIGQRGALAGDIDQIGMPSMQDETAIAEDFDEIRQGYAAFDMLTMGN